MQVKYFFLKYTMAVLLLPYKNCNGLLCLDFLQNIQLIKFSFNTLHVVMNLLNNEFSSFQKFNKFPKKISKSNYFRLTKKQRVCWLCHD